MELRKFGNTGRMHSPLGFGMMRLKKNADDTIDQEWVNKTLRGAIDAGLNYVDTAYIYPGSEVATGIALSGGYREKVTLASKLPVFKVTCDEDFDKLLNEELERLQTDHIDCYLLHAMSRDRWADVERLNLMKKMEQAKADGRIRHIGFSFHDSLDVFKTIIDAYDGWDFCQIQLNYLDVNYQAGLEGLEYAASKGIAVVIMEPLRGGRLADVPADVAEMLPSSPVESALDFLWDRPEISVVLSGMSTTEQVEQNLEYMNRAKIGMFTEERKQTIIAAGDKMRQYVSIPCTACDYCGVCPQEIPISKIFKILNQNQLDGNGANAKAAYAALGDNVAANCVNCKQCMEQCPQHIEIPAELEKAVKRFGGPM